MSDDNPDEPALPGLDPSGATPRGVLLLTLEVEGEVWEVRGHAGGTDYDWVSGPNAGYGFSSSAPASLPEESHRTAVQQFLAEVDPHTGYLPDD